MTWQFLRRAEVLGMRLPQKNNLCDKFAGPSYCVLCSDVSELLYMDGLVSVTGALVDVWLYSRLLNPSN